MSPITHDQRPLALRFPLRGSRLIEASAGTGKTFTISALYLRLVLGHGEGATGFGRELLPPEILVVTFTDAATRELRERIRNRLVEAAQSFRDEQAGDPLLRCCAPIIHARPGPTARNAWTAPPSGWTRRPSRPFTVGASACCASMPSTAAACSPSSCRPTTASCSPRWCATTGACTATRCTARPCSG